MFSYILVYLLSIIGSVSVFYSLFKTDGFTLKGAILITVVSLIPLLNSTLVLIYLIALLLSLLPWDRQIIPPKD